MKNRFLPIVLTAVLLSSCAARYHVSWFNLPRAGTKHELYSQRGALVVNPEKSPFENLVGELLYLDQDGNAIIETRKAELVTIAPKQYQDYKLHATRPQVTTAAWSVTTAPLLILPHGWFVVLTAPFSVVVSGMNAYSERHAYGLEMKELAVEQIRAQCRFPMGVPEDYRPSTDPEY